MTHDQALMWNRFERIFITFAAMGVVVLVTILTTPDIMNPSPFVAGTLFFTAFVGQLVVLKCWLDMIFKRKPDKNCWEFKE
jgi:hypothetical protein